MSALNAVKVLKEIMYAMPTIIEMITNYKKITDTGKVTPKDKASAKVLLNSLRWKDWDAL